MASAKPKAGNDEADEKPERVVADPQRQETCEGPWQGPPEDEQCS